jgi:hypothetical protein
VGDSRGMWASISYRRVQDAVLQDEEIQLSRRYRLDYGRSIPDKVTSVVVI